MHARKLKTVKPPPMTGHKRTNEMKTNSKELKKLIQNYVTECLNTEEYAGHDGTTKTSLQIVWDEFTRTAIYPYNLQRLKTVENCFVDWVCGLPSCLSLEFVTFSILELMSKWGLPLPEGKTEQEGEILYRRLIYREFTTLCKRHGVDLSTDKIEFTRVNNDTNGNPRYVCHFLNLLNDNEQAGAIDSKYAIALNKAKKIGGRKFHNKQYGGGIVFQSYNIADTERSIKELKREQ